MTKAGRRRRRTARQREIKAARIITGILIVIAIIALFSIEKAGMQAVYVSIASMIASYLIHTIYVPKYL